MIRLDSNNRELLLSDIGQDCMNDCSHQGECYDDVKYWAGALEFSVERNAAIDYLRSTGGWEQSELELLDDDELSYKVLWIACCDMREEMHSTDRTDGEDYEPCFYLGI